VFFEPSAYWSATTAHPTPAPGFTDDQAIVFAPHIYAGSLSADGGFLTPADGHNLAAAWAALHQTTYWSGEWGWFGDPAEAADDVKAYAAEEDSRLVGGAWWSWKQACGDPHQIGIPGTPPGAISPSLVRFACPGDREIGIPPPFGQLLSRPYVRAAPGLEVMESDAMGVLHVTGTDSGVVDAWVPGRGRVSVAVSGPYDIRISPIAPAAATTVAPAQLPATGGADPRVAAAIALGVVLVLRQLTRRGIRTRSS
jgi:endoglycosylceramidase